MSEFAVRAKCPSIRQATYNLVPQYLRQMQHPRHDPLKRLQQIIQVDTKFLQIIRIITSLHTALTTAPLPPSYQQPLQVLPPAQGLCYQPAAGVTAAQQGGVPVVRGWLYIVIHHVKCIH